MATRKTTSKASASPTPRKSAAKKTASGNGSPAKSGGAPAYDQVARKAYEIWVSKGRPQGQDEANWKEAEAALMKTRA